MARQAPGPVTLVLGPLAIIVAVLIVFGIIQRSLFPDPRHPITPWLDIGRGVVSGVLVAVYAFWILRARGRRTAATERSAAFLERLPVGVYVTDDQGRAVYANGVAVELLDRPSDTPLNGDAFVRHTRAVVADTDRPYPVERLPFQEALRTGRIARRDDIELRRPDGSRIRLAMVAEALRGPDGPVECLSTLEDVTEEKQAQQRLMRVHNLLRTVVESTPDAVYVKDLTGRYLLINAAGADAVGLPAKTIVGRTDTELFEAADIEEIMRADAAVFATGRPQHREETLKTVHGPRTFLASKAPVLDPSGRIVGLVGISRDITHRKDAQRKEAQLAAIVASSGEAILGLDPAGTIMAWNRGARTLFGWSEEEAVGRPVSMLFPEDRQEEGRRIITLALEGRHVVHHRTRRMTRAGKEIDVSVSVAPIREDRRVVGLSTIIRDISSQKHAEEERIRRVAKEHEVDRLRRYAALKTQFINTAAHELYTPLTPLQLQYGLLRHMREEEMDERERRAFDRIGRNIDRLRRLIKEVVDVSRLESEWVSFHERPFALDDTVHGALGDVRPRAEEKGVVLETRVTSPIEVVGDAVRIEQAVAHLLDNALKFSSRGQRIRVRAWQEDRRALVEVMDEAIGIEPAFIGSIFLPFEQSERHRDLPGSGWGLGLYIVKTIVERHGGRVRVESRGVGQGATFTFWLPVGGVKEEAPDAETVGPLLADATEAPPGTVGGHGAEAGADGDVR